MLKKTGNILRSKKLKYLLVAVIGVIALLMQIGVITAFVVQSYDIYGTMDGCGGGIHFSEQYDQAEQTYDLEIMINSLGTTEEIYAIDESGSQTKVVKNVGQEIEVEDLDRGDEIRVIGRLSDGTDQIIQTYTVAE